MIDLRCPVCGEKLFSQPAGYRCKKGHCFDRSREGYCNLLTGGRPHKIPGDNKEMARARHLFFSTDAYRILLNALCVQVERFLPSGGVLIDAGCGEGYYTSGIYRALSQRGISADVLGFDLSKFALRYGAKGEPGVRFFAASLFGLPLFDGCADLILSIFAPVAGEEFFRILRPGGTLLIALPGPRHLFGLKEVLYDKPYENQENHYHLPGFHLIERTVTAGNMTVEGQEMIKNLLMMTPYYYKSPREGCERLEKLETLTTPIDFEILAFGKDHP